MGSQENRTWQRSCTHTFFIYSGGDSSSDSPTLPMRKHEERESGKSLRSHSCWDRAWIFPETRCGMETAKGTAKTKAWRWELIWFLRNGASSGVRWSERGKRKKLSYVLRSNLIWYLLDHLWVRYPYAELPSVPILKVGLNELINIKHFAWYKEVLNKC